MSLKAFDLLPVTERISLGDKVPCTIECLECSGRNLYIGTSESFVLHYIVEESASAEGKTTFKSRKQGHKYLGFKKPVLLVKAVSIFNRILCLCDGMLIFLNMFDMEVVSSVSRLKGISYFCLNENPPGSSPFVVQVCVAKKRQLQLYNLTEDRLIHLKDVVTADPPLLMAMDGHFVCAAVPGQYVIVDCDTGLITELFPYDDEYTVPVIKRITKEEFLLSAPGALGMFAKTGGMTERPPLQWGSDVVAVSYCHPYILSLGEEFLTVHSILDQQSKQRMVFRGGKCLDNFDGKLYVATGDIIFSLVPVPWEKQVQALLADKKVGEALELAKYSNKHGLSKEQTKKIFQQIHQQAGFIEFSRGSFSDAKKLFQSGSVDLRELISLYPGLLPSSSNFVRAAPSLHSIADVGQLCRSQPDLLIEYRQFLASYLEEVAASKAGANLKLEIDTALTKLYAVTSSPKLVDFICSTGNACDTNEGADFLLSHKHYHALAQFWHMRGNSEKALQLWTKIVSGEYEDGSFPGLPFLVDVIAKLSDDKLVWKYADFIFEKDQILGVKIFTNRTGNETPSEKMRPDAIVDFLQRFPLAVVRYLEHLVFVQKVENEKFHTHLAMLYVDLVQRLLKQTGSSDEIKQARHKLQHLLQTSSTYRIQLLLGKALEYNLHLETAILYGKLGEHGKALKILVHKLQDYMAAEEYCLRMSAGRDRFFQHHLFHILLGVYLDPSLNEQDRENLLAPAVQLLNSEVAEFDAVEVLQLIPANWSIAIIDQFLNKALRTSLHRHAVTRVESALARGENLQVKFTKVHAENDPVVVTEERLCSVCNRPFAEPSFVWYPNGIVTHLQCAKQHITCPVTGKSFTCRKPHIR